MVKGRHAGNKGKKSTVTTQSALHPIPSGQQFVALDHDSDTFASIGIPLRSPLLLTLLFNDKRAQHASLARIEAFYESTSETRQYMPLDEALKARLCPNYEAFNCPTAVVREWLRAMQLAHHGKTDANSQPDGRDDERDDDDDAQEPFWRPFCNEQESYLLAFLDQLGCLDEKEADCALVRQSTPTYLVSVLQSQVKSSLPHEILHFLYFVSQEYRSVCQSEFLSLSSRARKVVETDLQMRKYAQHVWIDEFQAYISLNPAEFGAKASEECSSIQRTLQECQRTIWRSLAPE